MRVRALAEPDGRGAAAAIAAAVLLLRSGAVRPAALADTLEVALAYAYANNPQLNSQRALVRATDESVPTALAGYRPKAWRPPISACSRCRPRSARSARPRRRAAGQLLHAERRQHAARRRRHRHADAAQRLPDRQPHRLAESQVFAARETLRNIEQTVLLNAATAYMNLLRDAGILELQRRNLDVLAGAAAPDQRAAAKSGNVTATDVSQAEAAPQRRPHPVVCRRGQLCELAGGLPPGDRARPGQACAGGAGRPLHAAHAARRDGRRHRAKSHRHAPRSTTSTSPPSGQGRRGRALSDAVAARQRAEEL